MKSTGKVRLSRKERGANHPAQTDAMTDTGRRPYEWPRFAGHLRGATAAAGERLLSLLRDLGAPGPVPSGSQVLASVFDELALSDEIAALAPTIHHVGVVAPPDLDVGQLTALMQRSPFADRVWQFESVALAKDLSSRLSRPVKATVVQGNASLQTARHPAVEVFVTDLPADVLCSLVEQETGCHVALGLAPGHSLEEVRDVLHAHGLWEIPVMRHGPLTNRAYRSSLLYVDMPGFTSTRRLEFITPSQSEP